MQHPYSYHGTLYASILHEDAALQVVHERDASSSVNHDLGQGEEYNLVFSLLSEDFSHKIIK
jgi:hypothetical protein